MTTDKGYSNVTSLEDAEARIADLEQERAALHRTCQSYEKEITELKKEKQALEQGNKELAWEVDVVLASYRQMKKEKQALLKEIDHWTNWVDEYRKEKQALEQALQGWKTKFEFCKVQKDMERKALRDKIEKIRTFKPSVREGKLNMDVNVRGDWISKLDVLAVLDAAPQSPQTGDVGNLVKPVPLPPTAKSGFSEDKQPSDGNNSLPQLIEPSEAAPEYILEKGMLTHYVGIGVCGLPVIQVQTDKEKDTWKLFKVEGKRAISLGKDNISYEIIYHRPPRKSLGSGKSRASQADTVCTCGHKAGWHWGNGRLTNLVGLKTSCNVEGCPCQKFTPAHGGKT